jgi:predicted transglutaminase-like protease
MFKLLFILSIIAFFRYTIYGSTLFMNTFSNASFYSLSLFFWQFFATCYQHFAFGSRTFAAIMLSMDLANPSEIFRTIGLSIIFGSIFSLLLYGNLKYRNPKRIVPEFRFSDTFKISLPVENILQYHLVICRDYAKLTATLLMNYSKDNICFITIPYHVTTAIEVRDKIYVLDQRLPIIIRDKWIEYWSRRRSCKKMLVQVYKLILENGKIRVKRFLAKNYMLQVIFNKLTWKK